ncbi:MAG TPA: NDP-sugar synthase [Pyrinomonadaceae bacterium]|nr:NDP-sugar synthase [Chloracidobacterium sp.]MBP9936253.1 NDP-sugar synthase [Pyrinomonadaceae bacterium]MBK9437088.1 NDP-sugar synthase [Chloracidobacterium sp.]MBL0239761.1 NDP-sugar synthase [Chloracidobacterium sp.]HQX55006.1 NDP-sugar synthase [Pyrinomonadaceae bacterium]
MQALILAGGKGTRLRPLTVYTPKPIVPFCNRAFLLYQIENLRKAGITDITLSLSYQPDKIEHVLGNGSDYGVNLRFITEPAPLGTGGAYRFAAADIRETTVVFNGDILTDFDIGSFIRLHKELGSAATLALKPVENPSAYGLVETDSESKILRFLEKPSDDEIKRLKINTINAGIYVLEPEILDLMPLGENRSFEYDIFPEILKREMPFYADVMKDDYWRDIGTPASYLAAHMDFLNGDIRGFETEPSDRSDVATKAVIDSRSIIGSGCVIKSGARVTNSVIGPGVQIEEKAIVEDSVLWAHSRISTAAEIRGSIIGRSCHVGRNSILDAGSVIGDKSTLTDYTRV